MRPDSSVASLAGLVIHAPVHEQKGYEMPRFTLTNDFHDTETIVVSANGTLNRRQVRRAWKALCGTETCTCGGEAGQRGGAWGVEQADCWGETYKIVATA